MIFLKADITFCFIFRLKVSGKGANIPNDKQLLPLTHAHTLAHPNAQAHTFSRPLHICSVCFSELLKRQKTKSKEKRKERACNPSFCFYFSFSSPISSADLANRLIELLYSLVSFSFALSFFIYSLPLFLLRFISECFLLCFCESV